MKSTSEPTTALDLEGPGTELIAGLILMTLVWTIALCLPVWGWGLAGVLAAVGTWLYIGVLRGEMPPPILDGSDSDADHVQRARTVNREWSIRVLATGLATVGWLLPILLRGLTPTSSESAIPWEGVIFGLIGLVAWIGTPLALFLLVARRGNQMLGLRRAWIIIARSPFRAIWAIVRIPLLLICLETLVVGVLWATSWLPAIVWNRLPEPDGVAIRFNLVTYDEHSVPLRDIVPISHDWALWCYGQGIGRGYPVSLSVPASLPDPDRPRINLASFSSRINPTMDRVYRALLTASISFVLILGMAGQARVLSQLALLAPNPMDRPFVLIPLGENGTATGTDPSSNQAERADPVAIKS